MMNLRIFLFFCLVNLNVCEEEIQDDEDDLFQDFSLPKSPPENEITIQLRQGSLTGKLEESSKGNLFYSFYGIPYAEPPVGERRFQEPVEHQGWEGIRDGSKKPPACSQIVISHLMTTGKTRYMGQEDCLFLNVFRPADLDGLARPVMVFIHGGAFMSNSASDYEPYDLMNEDIILVVLQYRLGILGFASTEDSVMPGNQGLKDQTMALKWVQKNIPHFGGDPLTVTLFGSSAGAASVHYQILSHHSIGLFQRAILQSGTALCPWATGGPHRRAVQELAKYFQCTSSKVKDEGDAKTDSQTVENAKNIELNQEETDVKNNENESRTNKEQEEIDSQRHMKNTDEAVVEPDIEDQKETHVQRESEEQDESEEEIIRRENEEMLQCLQKVDVKKLTKTIAHFNVISYFPSIFGPIIDENFLPSTTEFLLKDARHKRQELIIGITKEEGAAVTGGIFTSEAKRMLMKFDFPFGGPVSMEYTEQDIAPLNMSITAFDKYAGGIKFDETDAYNITKLYSDRHFSVCSDLTAFMHHENNKQKGKNVYFYELHHRGEKSFFDNFGLTFGKEWVSHADELFYLFPMTRGNTMKQNEQDMRLRDIMTKMWANFAEVANPTPDNSLGFIWEPFSTEAPNHLVLKPEPYMENDTRKETREFWTSLPTQQNLFLFKENIKNMHEWSEQHKTEKKIREGGEQNSTNKDNIEGEHKEETVNVEPNPDKEESVKQTPKDEL